MIVLRWLRRFFHQSLGCRAGWCLGSSLLALLAAAGLGYHLLPGSSAGDNRLTPTSPPVAARLPAPAPKAKGRLSLAHMPLRFETNQGQTDAHVDYLARGPGYTLFLTPTEAAFRLCPVGEMADQPGRAMAGRRPAPRTPAALVRMQLLHSNPKAQATGLDRLPGKVNYFRGNDPSKWQTGISTFARVQYQAVYPGIDLVYYGNQMQLEYDFQVAPGADPGQIRLQFMGAQSVRVDDSGKLVVQACGQALRQHKPVAYQEISGERRKVAASFRVQDQQVCFVLGNYDRNQPLVIDPTLSYSTYLGGSGDEEGLGIAVDASGNAYVVGYTNSADFATANAMQPSLPGRNNAFVAKLSVDGTQLVYSTYLGGSMGDSGLAIGVDGAGSAYITGTTTSPDFPTVNPMQPHLRNRGGNAFVAKLTPDGSGLVYSTYLGGGGGLSHNPDIGDGIAVDADGSAYVTGGTESPDFPTANALQPVYRGGERTAFVAKLTADGSALAYSTYLGGSGRDNGLGIAVNGEGNAYVTGVTASPDFPTVNAFQPQLNGIDGAPNAFVAKLTPDGTALVYSTYLGGSSVSDVAGDYGHGIAVDAAGNAYVAGAAQSPDFPTTAYFGPLGGGAFVTKLDPGGSLVYSAILGGSGAGWAPVAVDTVGNVYLTGSASPLLPIVNPLQPNVGMAFVAELSADGSSLVFSTYLGGSGSDLGNGIALDPAENVYVVGDTNSPDFPTVNALQPTYGGGGTYLGDAFVTKISP